MAATTDVQAFSYIDQLQLQPEPNLLMLNKVTSENQGEQPTNNIGKSFFSTIAQPTLYA